MEYAAWLAAERRVSPHTEGLAVRALLAAAKHVWHAESTARPAETPTQEALQNRASSPSQARPRCVYTHGRARR